ncbi:MAG TPA: DUF2147 domain-containing protein [Parafilimonas sp.]|nr:DUF2147 domain-containing protein [Parafilimonas sp.]
MKYLLLFVLMITVIKSPAQTSADAILGQWESTEKNLIVEVYKQHKDFKAKVIWFYDEDDTITPIEKRLDIKNPNKNLRSRKILGADILSNLIYDPKQKRWEKGRIYDSSSGRTWDATVWLISPDALSVRGFYLVRWFGKTLSFRKVKPADASP